MFVPSKPFFRQNRNIYYLAHLFIYLKIKSQGWKLNVLFQIDASMTTIPSSFQVQNCRLSNSAKIVLESKALNALIPSSV